MTAIQPERMRRIFIAGLLILLAAVGVPVFRLILPTNSLPMKRDAFDTSEYRHRSLQILPVPDLDDTSPGPALPPPEAAKPALFDGDLFFSARFYHWSGHYYRSEYGGKYETLSDEAPMHLYRVQPDGTHLRQLTTGEFDDEFLALSCDGASLIFAREPREYSEDAVRRICRVSVKGGRVTTVNMHRTVTRNADIAISPDSQWLTIQTARWSDGPRPFTVCSLARNLIRTFHAVDDYSWSPDGRLYLRFANHTAEIVEPATMDRLKMREELGKPLWLDSHTLIGNFPTGQYRNGTTALIITDRGKEVKRLNPALIGPENEYETFNDDRSWYLLPNHPNTLVMEASRGMSDGTHFGCFRLDTRTGDCRLLGSGALMGVSADGNRVAIADYVWQGPYKRGGERVGPLRVVNLNSGQTSELTRPLSEIHHCMWQHVTSAPAESANLALFRAIETREREQAVLLLNGSVSAESRDAYSQTALMRACGAGSVGIVALLLERGADARTRSKQAETSLMTALGTGKEVDGVPTPIQLRIADLLLKHGVEINARDKYGKTALMVAAAKGRTRLVAWLIKHGAQVNLQDSEGRTALMEAAGELYPFTVTTLLRAGAEPNLRDKIGRSALNYIGESDTGDDERHIGETIARLLKSLGGKEFETKY